MVRAFLLFVGLCGCAFEPPIQGGGDDVVDPISVGFGGATSVQEEGAGTVMVSVGLSAAAADPVTVTYAIGGGTASPGTDFSASGGILTFAAGETQQAIAIDLVADSEVEGDETIELVLQAATGATLGASQHTLTITEDDVCIGSGAYVVCPQVRPTEAVTLPADLDTTDDPRCAAEQPIGWQAALQPEACFIFGTTITVTSTTVTGSRPLVLAATDAIIVQGLLDVSSRGDDTRGPGSPSPTGCLAFAQTPANDSSGAPGGAGATFRTKGGNGGDGGGSNNEGRSEAPAAAPIVLQAGCDGQPGGVQNDGDTPAGVGRGGGALYLVAGNTITITGLVNASGSGAPAPTDSKIGGSGGGSGGMIKLHATVITAATATLIANGGGGASGAGESSDGNAGSDPEINSPTTPANGGTGGGDAGGGGGRGFAGVTAAANAANNAGSNTGGGGGGGGGGFIQSNVALDGATLSGVIDPP